MRSVLLSLGLFVLFALNGQPAECQGDRCGRPCYGDGRDWCPPKCVCLQEEPGAGKCVRLLQNVD